MASRPITKTCRGQFIIYVWLIKKNQIKLNVPDIIMNIFTQLCEQLWSVDGILMIMLKLNGVDPIHKKISTNYANHFGGKTKQKKQLTCETKWGWTFSLLRQPTLRLVFDINVLIQKKKQILDVLSLKDKCTAGHDDQLWRRTEWCSQPHCLLYPYTPAML